MADSVQIELEVVAKKALASVEAFTKGAQKSLDSISVTSAISAINASFELLGKTVSPVFAAIESGFSRAIEEGLNAEQSQFKLANALRLTGDAANGALDEFQAFAKQVQRTTTFTDDAVIAAVGLAKSYQLTNAEARRAVSVAVDLAAATGTDLDTAVVKVAQTFNGFVDKSLSKVIPSLKNLSTEALIGGDALGLIEKRVEGTAEALSNTLGGSLTRARNSANDLFETIGKLFTENAAVASGVRVIIDSLIALNDELEKNSSSLKQLVTNGFVLLVNTLPLVAQAMKNVATNFTTAAFAIEKALLIISQGPTAILQAVTGTNDALNALRNNLEKLDQKFGESLNRQADLFDPIIKSANDISTGVSNAATSTLKLAKANEDLDKSVTGVSVRLAENGEKIADETLRAFTKSRDQIEKISKEPIKQLVDVVFGAKIDTKAGIAIGAGLVNSIAKGAEGARDLISTTIGAIADAYLPGIGSAVKGIIDFLSQGPEQVRKTVMEFVRAIPQFIKNVLTALPEIMIGFFEAIPDFISALIEAVPKIIEAFIRALPRLFAAILKLWVKGIPIIVKEFIFQIPNIIKGFVIAIVDAAKTFVNAIVDGIKEFFGGLGGNSKAGAVEGIPIVGDIVGFVGGAFGSAGDFLGLAEGGRVPDVQRFEGDRFPARLDAGEQVFSGDLSDKLEQFLSGQSSQPIQITLNVGQSELAKVMLNLNRNGFRTA
jgi:hypothetical protein